MLSKKTFLVLIALVAVVILAVAACQQAPATTAPTEPPPAETEVAAPVETAAPEPTQAVEYKPEIRKATKAWKIGYGDGLAGIPFTQSVTDSINEVAKEMGVEIVYCDNAYNQEKHRRVLQQPRHPGR